MDNEVRKQNMVPGSCDQFTNPEEISALSKYLKARKTELESRTTMNQDTLEVYGRKDPRFLRDTEKLPDQVAILDKRKDSEVSSLVSSKEWLDSGKDLETLEKMREKLSHDMPSGTRLDITPDNSSQTLAGEKPSLPGQKANDVLLSQVREILAGQGLNTEGLSQYRGIVPEGITQKNNTLGDYIESLSSEKPGNINTLPGSKEKISDNSGLSELEGRRKELEGTKGEPSLDDKRINISDQRDNSLGSSRINLNDQRDNSLDDKRINISDQRDNSLGSHVENINDQRTTILPTHLEPLSDTRSNELETGRLSLTAENEPSLENYIESVKPSPGSSIELGDTQLGVPGEIQDQNLPTERERISDNRTTVLSEYVDVVSGISADPSLSQTRIERPGEEDANVLSDTREPLVGKSQIVDPELEDYRGEVPGSKDNTPLEDTREQIPGEITDKELPTEKLTITDTRDLGSLPDDALSIEQDQSELDRKETTGGNVHEVASLEDTKESLTVTSQDNLSDTRIGLVEDQSELNEKETGDSPAHSIGSLEDTKEGIPGEITDQELPDTRLDLLDDQSEVGRLETGDNPNGIGQLEDTRINLAQDESQIGRLENGDQPNSISQLEDTREELPQDQSIVGRLETGDSPNSINQLEDTRIQVESDKSILDQKEIDGNIHEAGSLENTRVELLDDQSVVGRLETSDQPNEIGQLEDTRLQIEQDQSNLDRKEISEGLVHGTGSLEDTRIQIEQDQSNLDSKETTDSSNVHSNSQLEDTRINILEDQSQLDRKEVDGNVHEAGSLEDTRVGLLDDQSIVGRLETGDQPNGIEQLEDTRVDIIEDQSNLDRKEVSGNLVHESGQLEDTRLQIIEDRSNLDKKETTGSTNVHEAGSLEDTRLSILEDKSNLDRKEIDDGLVHNSSQLEDTRLQVIEDQSQLDRKEVEGSGNVHESGQLEDTRLQIIEDASQLDRKETTDSSNVHTSSQLEDTRLQIIQDESQLDRKEIEGDSNVHESGQLEDTRLQIIGDQSELDRKEALDDSNVHTNSQLEDTRLQIIQDSSELDRKETQGDTNVHEAGSLEDTRVDVIQDQSDLDRKEVDGGLVHEASSLEDTILQIIQDESQLDRKETTDDTNVHTVSQLEDTILDITTDESILHRLEMIGEIIPHEIAELEDTRLDIDVSEPEVDDLEGYVEMMPEEQDGPDYEGSERDALEDTRIDLIDDFSIVRPGLQAESADHIPHDNTALDDTRLQIIQDASQLDQKEIDGNVHESGQLEDTRLRIINDSSSLDRKEADGNVHETRQLEDYLDSRPEEEAPKEDSSYEGEEVELKGEDTKINPVGEDPEEELYTEGTSRDFNKIDDAQEVEALEDYLENLPNEEAPEDDTKKGSSIVESLEDKKITLEDLPDDTELYDAAIELPVEKAPLMDEEYEGGEAELSNTVIKGPTKNDQTLYDSALALPELTEDNKLYTKDDRVKLKEQEHPSEDQDHIGTATSLEGYIDSIIHPGEGESSVDTRAFQKPAANPQVKLHPEKDRLERPRYKLPKTFNLGSSINPSTYLRWIVEEAEAGIHGPFKQLILDESLAIAVEGRDALERTTGMNKDRLPGNDLVQGIANDVINGDVGGLVKTGVKALMGGDGIDMEIPHNRPKKEKDTKDKEETRNNINETQWTALNRKSVGTSLGKVVKDNYVFANEYFFAKDVDGLAVTLEELCGHTAASIKTVEDLFDYLKNSPYINTATKSTSGRYNPLKVYTLDSNDRWEIIFEPFIGEENGNKSFLPPIQEINVWNKFYHGVETEFGRWAPISSFELSKGKLANKSINLYDGEFSIPTSYEMTNEIRISFVDDQFKSWRNYFERCVDCMVYASEVHNPKDYDDSYSRISKIDKKYVVLAPWRNVVFRATVYCMTPQYSTINKYDLLLTLRDFSEERSGETDASGTDLSVTFSIVGENPSSKKRNMVDTRKLLETVEHPSFDNINMRDDSNWVADALGKAASSVAKVLF